MAGIGNQGHSTKAQRPDDKRLNQNRALVNQFKQSVSLEQIMEVMEKLRTKAVKEGDVNASKIWLSYAIGAPDQNIDHTSLGEKIGVPITAWVNDSEEPKV